MLVLTRKYQEKIHIGDNITITVLRTKGKTVRLGIEAPTDVPVIRGELAFEPAAPGVATTAPAAAVQTASSPRAGSSMTWAVEPPHRAGQVSLKRVPRDKVAASLPQLASGTKPLRAMMDQR